MTIAMENSAMIVKKCFTLEELVLDQLIFSSEEIDKIWADAMLKSTSIKKLTLKNMANSY